MDTIPILVSLPDKDEEVKGIFSLDAEVVLRDIPTELLRDNLNKLCQGVGTLLNDIKKVGGFRLKEVTVQVEVSAEGGVELIGTAKVGGKGAITLTFAE
ncbi:hypothetical protein CDG76_23360 [Nostoc sp. 'Peltigera membranacea cyanobiont' 210A]|nr:hypothetical protein CDG76_23360 [Nostoc sp. 'Peltigera membranacea cyanobiont' 210A]